jgi:hypothetical protein
MTRTRNTKKLHHEFGVEDLIKRASHVNQRAKHVRGKYAAAEKKIREMERLEKKRQDEARDLEDAMRSREINLATLREKLALQVEELNKKVQELDDMRKKKEKELDTKEAKLKQKAEELDTKEAELKIGVDELKPKGTEPDSVPAAKKRKLNDSGSLPPSNNFASPFLISDNDFTGFGFQPNNLLNNQGPGLQECQYGQATELNEEAEVRDCQNSRGIVLQTDEGDLAHPAAVDDGYTWGAATPAEICGYHFHTWYFPEEGVDPNSLVDFSPLIEE